eukprot:PITA_32554
MASSSTSTSHSGKNDYKFDIFINHRGPDVKKTFATDLYNCLCKHDLKVFLDAQELRVGENLTPQIESAIRTSCVNIAIFSPNYAYSKWCLDELVLMVECMSKNKSTIIPVFYGVKPADLRWTQDGKGVYAEALYKLQGKKTFDGQHRHDSKIIGKWKNALSSVAEIIGFDGEKYNSMEQLREDVVEGVLKNVKRRLYVSEYPKGLEGKLKDFETTMSLQQEDGKVRVIGIVGLGGVGKTTLAKEFFNNQGSKYKRLCILEDIRDNPLTTLQKYLLKDLTQKDEEIRSINEGKGKLRRLLPSSDCLIILDDVDNIEQLEALLYPAKDALKSSSLILVTSRNKDVLIRSQIPETSMYMLQGLDPEHSRELFCWYAFRKPHPAVGFDKEVEKFLGACLGLPLSIKVFGSLLCGINDLNHWEAQFRKISNMLPGDIQGRLRISYDGLDEEEKNIFLDIACFFRGEKRDRVIRILNRTGWEGTLGLWKLENRCLVQVDSENRLRMHDHVRDMGRYLAEKEPPDGELRLWNPTANLFLELSGQLPVRGISLVNVNEVEQSFENLAEPAHTRLLSNMSRLQLLKAEGYFPKCLLNVCHHLPNLIYLEWLRCPESSLPSWIPTKNLRVLHIKGKSLKTLWQHEYQAPLQLRELCIRAPLLNVPDFIGNLQHLEIFVLSHSSHLESLPDSVGNLARLQHLHLLLCSDLQTLPDSVGNLASLQHLKLTYCFDLQKLPDSVGNLAGLQHLNLTDCTALRTLPDSVGNLAGLQHLDLRRCSALQRLPDSVGNLAGLQHLDLSRCSALQALPDSVGNLAGLQHLDLGECSYLQRLPDSVGNLAGLQHLDLWECAYLQTLPDSVGNLAGLQYLDLRDCSALQTLPDSVGNLAGLQHLDLRRCSALQTLPDSVGNLAGLQHLDLRECSALQTLPDSVGNLAGVQHLDLSYWSALQTLPDSVGNLAGLQHLDLSYCSALQRLPDSVGELRSLRNLVLSECSALKRLPDSIGNLTSLQALWLAGCFNLEMVPNVEHLGSLEYLNVFQCFKLQWDAGIVEQLRQRLGEGFIEERMARSFR